MVAQSRSAPHCIPYQSVGPLAASHVLALFGFESERPSAIPTTSHVQTPTKRVFSAGALRVGTPRPRVCCGACTPITTTQPAGAKNKVGQAPMKEREAGCVGGVASTRCCVLGRSVSALSTPRAQEVLSSAAAPRDHTPPRDHAACRRVHPPVSVYPCSAAHEAARMMGGPGRAKVLGARCDHQRVGCWLSGNSLHLHHRHRCRHLASNGN
jgi:hypothetical protein